MGLRLQGSLQGWHTRILSYPGSWRQVSLHFHHLQLLAGGEAEADGSSDYVMVTAWEGSHLHFLKDWLPVGEKPEPHASAKWFLHRTPLSRTVPSFNLPLYKQNNENFPPRSWLCGPPRSFLTGSRLVCAVCLLATAHCLLSSQDISNPPLRDNVHPAWAMRCYWMWKMASYQLWGIVVVIIII